MTMTSALAKQIFAFDIEGAKRYDDGQYVYTVNELQRMFHARVAEAAIAASFPKVIELYDDLTEKPDSARDDGIRIVSTKKGAKVLAIPDGDGNDLLYAWDTGEKRGHIRLFRTKPPLPVDLRAQIDSLINNQDFDLDALLKAKELAAPYSIENRGEYVDPTDIAGVIESIDERGLEKAKGDIFVYGSYYNSTGGTSFHATIPHNSSMASIEHIVGIFGIEDANREFLREEEYLDFLETGTVREQEDSVSALQLETLFERKMGMIKEIVQAAEHLELGPKTYVEYNDHDRNVLVHRTASKDIYVHNNIDRWENVYLLALNGEGNDYHSVDIHISKPWYATLTGKEIYDDEAMTWETLIRFIDYQDENGGTLREDQAIEALVNDEKPGLVGSYNFKKGEFTRGPFFENTNVLSYLSDMIDIDHNALTNGIRGELDEVGTFSIKTRDETATDLGDEEDFKIEDWLAKIGKSPAPSI